MNNNNIEKELKNIVYELNNGERNLFSNYITQIDYIKSDCMLDISIYYIKKDLEYKLEINYYKNNVKIFERPIGLLKFYKEVEFMQAIKKIYNYDFTNYNYTYYKNPDNDLPELYVKINNKNYFIKDTAKYMVINKEIESDESDYFKTGRYIDLCRSILIIYIHEYAKFEYVDINKILMRIHDITFEIPYRNILKYI